MRNTEISDFPADPVQGYFVDYSADNTIDNLIAFKHSFCGPQDVRGAWCPNCQKPLLCFLALDMRDTRLNLQNSMATTLSLLFCWTCNIAQEPFFYRVFSNGGIKILQYGQGGVETEFPYEDYPLFFPGSEAILRSVTAEEQAVLNQLNNRFETEETTSAILEQRRDLWSVRHQIGGEPFLIQGLRILVCPVCAAEMPFFASVANDCLDARGLAGYDGVQVLYHYCRPCCVVGGYQMTD